jgi:Raf kinase inhibitor-like YbhB/YbcL family protein
MTRMFACAAALLALPAAASALELRSDAFEDGGTLPEAQVFEGMGCEGGNVSPPLAWSGAPEGTRSFALTVYDPDAPTGSGWWHWTVVNIPPDVTELPAGASDDELPKGAIETRTDFGTARYGGACPPPGDGPHRYVFTIHALGVDSLPLDPDASGAMAGFMINANELARASITATYGR